MTKRNSRVEMKLSVEEAASLRAGASRRKMPVARYSRECALAVARGAVVPAEWLREATDDLIEAQAKIQGVRDYMPRGWEADLAARMDDIVHAQEAALEGSHPGEGC